MVSTRKNIIGVNTWVRVQPTCKSKKKKKTIKNDVTESVVKISYTNERQNPLLEVIERLTLPSGRGKRVPLFHSPIGKRFFHTLQTGGVFLH